MMVVFEKGKTLRYIGHLDLMRAMQRALRRSEKVFLPQRPQADCDADYRLWKRAVGRAADWIEH